MNDLAQIGCKVQPTGLEIVGELTPERWEQIGNTLGSIGRSMMWLIGDWLIAGEGAGYIERGKLAEACKKFGIEYGSGRVAMHVSRTYPLLMRINNLSWSHHQLVTGREDAAELLDWAVKNDATLQQLREEKHRRTPQPGAAKAKGCQAGHEWEFVVGNCEALPYPDDTFDLVFCSPPYEAQRSYSEADFSLSGEEWVEWATRCYLECLRVCRGLVAWVVEGPTDDFAYSCSPFLLMSDLHRRGVKVRKPCVYQRNGIPGTGGPDWLRNDWEPIICATKNGRLPWSDNTAMGKKPKQNHPRNATNRNKDGSRKNAVYNDPEIANPGNIITGLVGGGGLGWKDAHSNEAPFPEWLATFFIKSFCPVGGKVLDPFSGSGTTVAMAVKHGRNAVGIDVRESQVWLGETRLMGLSVSERKNGQGLLLCQ